MAKEEQRPLEEVGPDAEAGKRAEGYRNERFDKIIEKAKQSEYWGKPLPGNEDWGTVGDLIESLKVENLLAGSKEDADPHKLAERLFVWHKSKKERNDMEERVQIKDVKLEKFNPYIEGSEPWKEVENFFSNELPKYDAYVKEHAKRIIADFLYKGTQETEEPNYDGYISHDILDNSGQVSWFSSGWVDQGDWDNGYEFSLSGFTPFQATRAVTWKVSFEEKR